MPGGSSLQIIKNGSFRTFRQGRSLLTWYYNVSTVQSVMPSEREVVSYSSIIDARANWSKLDH